MEIRACKGRPRQTIIQRFLSYQEAKPSGCIEWTGHRFHFGHGCFTTGRIHLGETQTHRLSYMLHHGLMGIPEGKCITHNCDNPPCVNPDHLSLGTKTTNNYDIDTRKRRQYGEDRPAAKLTDNKVIEARHRYITGATSVALAKEYGVSQAAMYDALNYKTWKNAQASTCSSCRAGDRLGNACEHAREPAVPGK